LLPKFRLNDASTLLQEANAVPFSEKQDELCPVLEDCPIPSAASLDFLLEAETILSPMAIVEPISAVAINTDKNANLTWFLFMIES